MFIAVVKELGAEKEYLVFRSENRNYMRNLQLLCKENKLECEVTEEVKPRVVKFKGVD